ncbi:MAG: hypothetical protein QW404_02995 [Candidatus Nanoarchaeia archaeon]
MMPKAKKKPAPKAKAAPMPKIMPKPMPKMMKKAPAKTNKTMAMIGLLVNVLLPLIGVLLALYGVARGLWLLFGIGIGTIIAGKTKIGLWQLLLVVVGFVFLIYPPYGTMIGVPLVIVAWIWGIWTGVQAVKEAS